MSDPTRSPRFLADMRTEADPSAPVRLWYFSFADGSLPRGSQFLGGLFVRAKTLSGALVKSHRDKLNPGGEAQILMVEDESLVPERAIGRLLTKEQLEGDLENV